MHYYQFNIADYRKDTAHLSLLEHGIYRQLLDSYYLDEKPIETQSVIRRLSIITNEEKLAFENVLSDFFTPSDCGKYYTHCRVDGEISKYHDKADIARANGSKGGRPKKPKETQPVNLGSKNKPEAKLTNNQELNNQELNNQELNNQELKPSDKSPSVIDRFDDFWKLYPKKTDKKKARAAWDKLKPDDDLAIKIITNVADRLSREEWVKSDTQFIPHGTTFLNGARWEDEPQANQDVENKSAREQGANDWAGSVDSRFTGVTVNQDQELIGHG